MLTNQDLPTSFEVNGISIPVVSLETFQGRGSEEKVVEDQNWLLPEYASTYEFKNLKKLL